MLTNLLHWRQGKWFHIQIEFQAGLCKMEKNALNLGVNNDMISRLFAVIIKRCIAYTSKPVRSRLLTYIGLPVTGDQ